MKKSKYDLRNTLHYCTCCPYSEMKKASYVLIITQQIEFPSQREKKMIRCQYCLCCVGGEIMKWRIYFVVPLQTSKAFAVRTVKGAIRSEVKILRKYVWKEAD